MIIGIDINDYEKKIVASEWDGGWFCADCDSLSHWEEKAYMIHGYPHCRNCAEKHAKKGDKY